MDCITDLDDNQSRLLEALQLSLPVEAAGNRKKRHDKKLSLNPIYRQVPRVVDLCCQHLEKHGTHDHMLYVMELLCICGFSHNMLRDRNLVNHASFAHRPADGWNFPYWQLQEESATGTISALTSTHFSKLQQLFLL